MTSRSRAQLLIGESLTATGQNHAREQANGSRAMVLMLITSPRLIRQQEPASGSAALFANTTPKISGYTGDLHSCKQE